MDKISYIWRISNILHHILAPQKTGSPSLGTGFNNLLNNFF